METLRQHSTWIFDKRTDILSFSGVLLISYIWIALMYLAGYDFNALAPYWLIPIIHMICDGSHIFATIYHIRRRSMKFQYLSISIYTIVLIFGAGVAFLSDRIYIIYVAYFAAFHFLKQQYGWMMIAGNKNGYRDANEKLIDQFAIYNSTLIPLLIWMCAPSKEYGWFKPNDIINLNFGLSGQLFLTFIHFAFWSFYFIYQLRINKSTKFKPYSKYQILFTTWMVWFPSLVLIKQHIPGLILFGLSHGLQYIILSYRFEKTNTKNKLITHFAFPAIFYISIVFISTIEIYFNKTIQPYLNPARLGIFQLCFLKSFVNSFQITHYILDGLIWKTSTSPQVAKFFKASTNENK